MKTCTKCNIGKPESEYNRKYDGLRAADRKQYLSDRGLSTSPEVIAANNAFAVWPVWHRPEVMAFNLHGRVL